MADARGEADAVPVDGIAMTARLGRDVAQDDPDVGTVIATRR